jgi:sulfur carrier protein ThiS
MVERNKRRQREEEGSAAPVGGQVAAVGSAGGSVQVIWGSMMESLELAEMSVGDAFRMLQAPFNIAPAVAALVNGDPVNADHRLEAGDELEFTRPAGEKGAV